MQVRAQTPRPLRLAILAQWSADDDLPAHVRMHLERLRPHVDRLILVSNSPLDAVSRATAESICDKVVERRNIGWDFAGWRDVLASEDMDHWDEVILTNSSVVGPLFDLAPVLEEMASRDADFWGMVLSRHRAPHLQSYFLSFSRPVITSRAWTDFWSGVEDLADKRAVISRYEVRLTGILERAGFRHDALFPNPPFLKSFRMVHVDRLKQRRIPMSVNYINKTVDLHEDLIRAGMPYLKASLLWGKDTYRLKDIERIKRIGGVDYPWDEIGF